jgi:hypothetical protein
MTETTFVIIGIALAFCREAFGSGTYWDKRWRDRGNEQSIFAKSLKRGRLGPVSAPVLAAAQLPGPSRLLPCNFCRIFNAADRRPQPIHKNL